MIPEAYDPGTVTGLLIYAANCQVKNLSFQNFNWNGLTLEYAYATNNTIAGCWFGLDYTGTNVAPNAYQGILICAGASRNIIGGTNALARNVLSGNSEDGIFITDSNTTGNVVLGNYIGTDASGERALNNAFGGVVIQGGANSNIIGSPIPSGHNVLSGNVNYGLWVGSDNNTVQGNWIGLDAGGAVALPNTFAGIYVIDGAQSNLITGNVLSGNYSEGIRLAGAGTSANRVQGNFIGTDVTGTNAIPNGFAGLTFFAGAAGNTAGGLTTATRNIISGNGGYGVVIGDTNTTGNGVEGNFIGVGADGIHAVGNGIGVLISNGAQTNTLGGVTTGARNIISGNLYSGILITDPGTSWNSVQGNYAGTAPGGSTALGNGYEALDIVAGAQNNTVGGTATGAGNVLSGNGTRGVWISDTNTTGNLVQGNDIGLAADGATALGNAWEGVIVINGAQSNVIGLKTDGSGAGNRISANGYEGVAVYDDSTVGNVIRGNNVYSNGYLGINLVGGTENSYGVTANHPGGAVPGPNDLQNYPIITNAFVSGSSTVISGTLNSTAGRTFLIDVYRNTLPDPSGYGEGQVYLGSVAAATGGSGNAQFSFNAGSNFAGQYFSATATDQTSGDTSEFGFDVVATNLPAPPSFTGPATLTSTGFAANILLTTGQSYHVQSSTNLGANPIPWVNLTNFVAGATNFMFLDRSATNYRSRFYRVVSP
jgi:hypothetical protein